ncbi:hypothetical protein [Streptomyces albus]|uniref:hypothetical protein n=1 Tax=Streptomyces albus TaxID=1888 RepID=UPI0015D50514|nr:hypothetical protein [Streptomyces albus]
MFLGLLLVFGTLIVKMMVKPPNLHGGRRGSRGYTGQAWRAGGNEESGPHHGGSGGGEGSCEGGGSSCGGGVSSCGGGGSSCGGGGGGGF